MRIRNVAILGSTGLALVCVPYTVENYPLHVMIMICLYVILTSSFNLLAGYTGQLSMAHAAFFGIGGYASAIMVMRMGMSFWVALPAAAALTGLLGILLGYPGLRMTGHYFVIVTLAFGETIRLIFNNEVELTGGPDGLVNIPSPEPVSLQNLTIDFTSKVAYYYLTLATVSLILFVIYMMIRSRIGRILVSIREDERLAQCLGVDPMKYKIFAFTVSGIFAGIAGSLYAHYIRAISPDAFSFLTMMNILVMAVVGGLGTILGPIIGSIVMTIVSEYLRVFSELRWVVYGLALIMIVMVMPEGIVGRLRHLDMSRTRSRRRSPLARIRDPQADKS